MARRGRVRFQAKVSASMELSGPLELRAMFIVGYLLRNSSRVVLGLTPLSGEFVQMQRESLPDARPAVLQN